MKTERHNLLLSQFRAEHQDVESCDEAHQPAECEEERPEGLTSTSQVTGALRGWLSTRFLFT